MRVRVRMRMMRVQASLFKPHPQIKIIIKTHPYLCSSPWGLGALASIVIGVYPQTLYQILPFSSDYSAFHLDHFIEQMELVIFACLAYLIIKKLHLIPREKNITLLDIDWLARALPYHFRNEYQEQYLQKRQQIALFQHHLSQYFTQALRASFQMNGLIVREHSVGFMALWIAIMLAVILLLVYNL